MGFYHTLSLIAVALSVCACTSDPNAPVNQTYPIRQMDQFFGGPAYAPAPYASRPAPDYSSRPGYAPAYPPYTDQ